jgi:prephenate dehydrogenase
MTRFSSEQDKEPIGIIGLGLIGGSIGKALIDQGRLVRAFDTDKMVCEEAAKDGVVVCNDAAGVIHSCSVVFIAVPMTSYPLMAECLASQHFLTRRVLIIDVGSARGPAQCLIDVARSTFGVRFIGSHPMAGSELQGYRNARADLFSGATWIILPENDSTLEDFVMAATIPLALGAYVLVTESVTHDDAVARVSHLSHVLAGVLARAAGLVPTASFNLSVAAGSFRDGTRVVTSSPAFVAELCLYNAKALLSVIQEAVEDMGRFTRALANGDREGLENLFSEAHAIRQRFLSSASADRISERTLSEGEDWRQVLLNLGKGSFRISKIDALANGSGLLLTVVSPGAENTGEKKAFVTSS